VVVVQQANLAVHLVAVVSAVAVTARIALAGKVLALLTAAAAVAVVRLDRLVVAVWS
jgi:hypothetical protein